MQVRDKTMKVVAEFEVNDNADKRQLVEKLFELGELKLLKLRKLEIVPYE